MRQYIFWALIVISIPYILKKPFWGVVLYTAFNIIRPEMLFWGGTQAAKVFIILISIATVATFIKLYSRNSKPSFLTIILLPVDFAISFIQEVFRQSYLRLILWLYIALVVSIELSSYYIPQAYYYANEIFKVLVLCVLVVINIKSDKEVKIYENIILLVFVLLGIWGIDQYFRGNERLEGLGGNAFPDSNGIAAMFVLIFPLALNMIMSPGKKKKIFAGLIASFIILALVICTSSRGGLVGLIISSFVFIIYSKHKGKMIIAVIVLYISVSPFLTEGYLSRMNTMSDIDNIDYSAKARLILWEAGIMIFRDNPIFGTGFQSFASAKFKYKKDFYYLDTEFLEYVFIEKGSRVSHNTYVQVLSEGGLFMAIPFFWLLLGTFWNNWRIRRGRYNMSENNNEMVNLLSSIEAGIVGYCASIMFINALMGIFLFLQIIVSAIIRRNITSNTEPVLANQKQ